MSTFHTILRYWRARQARMAAEKYVYYKAKREAIERLVQLKRASDHDLDLFVRYSAREAKYLERSEQLLRSL